MAAALADLVLKKLCSLAADQAGALWGIESELLKLQSTVSTIQAVLLDAEEQSSRSHQVQQWLQELKEVLYDAEDLLDDYSTEALRVAETDCSIIKNVVYELKVANQIKAIRSKLVDIDQNRKQFDFQTTRPGEEANKEWRQTHSSVPELVVGREGDKQRIIDMLMLSGYGDKVAVIPIVGIGGLGKTTLAQQVYNDDRIESHFECKYWVCVSETFEPKLLVRNVLESITKGKVEDLAFNTLKDLLHERIKNKRLLLVLDDVWNEDIEKWVRFKGLFSSGAAEGSRIIVTTRLGIVGEMTATETIVPHELQGLSEPESWCLFEKVAFKGGVASSGSRYEEIGKDILRKCGGVPLAIRSMAGLLYFKDSESEWEAVREKQMLSLDLSGPDSEILASTLRLSYDNLPSKLKRCFAYCALFPKDHKFSVRMLIQLWLAQGYIIVKSSQSSPHKDVGVESFKNLLWRSFFQELTKDAWGNMQSCKMHDLMHDLAVAVSREDTVILNGLNLTDSFLNSSCNVSLEKIRHISIDFENRFEKEMWRVPTLLAKATKLRTFLVINVPYKSLKMAGECETIFSKMIRLRVLSLKNTSLQIIPSTIHKLKHCRYLDLSGNEMHMLPDEITTLVNLQVLNLCWCENLLQLPRGIRKLSNLMYIDLNGCWGLTCIPAGIGKLCHLRELSLFAAAPDSRAAGLGEMNLLNNLSGKLCIRGLQWVKDKSEVEAANLKEKSQIRRLELRWSNSSSTSSSRANHERSILEALQPHSNLKEIELWSYGGTSLPTSWFSSLRNVVRMQLTRSKKLQCLPSLEPFVSLEELQLTGLESLEYVQKRTISPSSPSSYDLQLLPSLKSLEIWNCPNLVGWWLNNESPQLPRISKLAIRGCPKMVSMPRFSEQLEDVELVDVSCELLDELVHARLHSLTIRRVKDLRVLPQLTSVDSLRVFDCPNLIVLSPATFQILPSLQKLVIYNCRALELEDSDVPMPPCVTPSLLRILDVSKVDKLDMLPKWLQHSVNLQQLVISSCDNFKSLPSWLNKLTKLESLVIKDCEVLSARCRSSRAEDWPNISHVANIEINGVMIQKHGRYLVLDKETEAKEETAAEEELEPLSEARDSRMLANCTGWLTCNLLQRCFLP